MIYGPIEVLKDVVSRLDQQNIPYFLVGSLASMYYGKPRFTRDVDLVVQIQSRQVQSFEKLFPLEDYYCPPTEVLGDEIVRRGSFNLIHHASGIKIDIVILKDTDFYHSEFSRRAKVDIVPQFYVWIASAEDIIIKKLDYYREGGSDKHLIDIREILACTTVDETYLQNWIQHFGLKEMWEKV